MCAGGGGARAGGGGRGAIHAAPAPGEGAGAAPGSSLGGGSRSSSWGRRDGRCSSVAGRTGRPVNQTRAGPGAPGDEGDGAAAGA